MTPALILEAAIAVAEAEITVLRLLAEAESAMTDAQLRRIHAKIEEHKRCIEKLKSVAALLTDRKRRRAEYDRDHPAKVAPGVEKPKTEARTTGSRAPVRYADQTGKTLGHEYQWYGQHGPKVFLDAGGKLAAREVGKMTFDAKGRLRAVGAPMGAAFLKKALMQCKTPQRGHGR